MAPSEQTQHLLSATSENIQPSCFNHLYIAPGADCSGIHPVPSGLILKRFLLAGWAIPAFVLNPLEPSDILLGSSQRQRKRVSMYHNSEAGSQRGISDTSPSIPAVHSNYSCQWFCSLALMEPWGWMNFKASPSIGRRFTGTQAIPANLSPSSADQYRDGRSGRRQTPRSSSINPMKDYTEVCTDSPNEARWATGLLSVLFLLSREVFLSMQPRARV